MRKRSNLLLGRISNGASGSLYKINKDRIFMSTVKERVSEIVQALPDYSSFDEILQELAFSRMVDRGLVDSRRGQIISNQEMEHRIRTWQK